MINYTRSAFAAARAYRQHRSPEPRVRRIQRAMVNALFDHERPVMDGRVVSEDSWQETFKWEDFNHANKS